MIANIHGASEGLVQRTLKKAIYCTGVGLHSGARVSMSIAPAGADAGIAFRRTDLRGGQAVIPALWNRVADTKLCTVIANRGGISVGTIEHLMAALRGCGIDNAMIEIDGPEVPIMDGSADPFVFLIEAAGAVTQGKARRAIRVLKPIAVGDYRRGARLTPGSGFTFSFEIDFKSAAVAHQDGYVALTDGSFKQELARARTFGFLHEVEQLRRLGLARGGSLANAIVVSGDRVLNEGGLRYPDEFVRHKLLDSIGDLYLAGAPIIGHFHGQRAGHAVNNQLLHALFADRDAWCLTELATDDLVPQPWSCPTLLAARA
ncbi:MAG: UDP-3-O-acyl-N-acetylglucosamine deacetylase [Azospirillum sp.]|nr:UDP-3-O-acyl-N-acetylglucosamine deacetylase [Azospirillum sp.]